jgi:hypothetical protein
LTRTSRTNEDVEDELLGKGGHEMVNASQIAKAGYPSLNVLVAGDSLIQSNPAAVQSYVTPRSCPAGCGTGPPSPAR